MLKIKNNVTCFCFVSYLINQVCHGVYKENIKLRFIRGTKLIKNMKQGTVVKKKKSKMTFCL